jgi:hypothetical protein
MLRLADDGKSIISIASSGASAETAATLVEMLLLKVERIAQKVAQERMLQARVHGVNLTFGAVSNFQVSPEYLGLLIGTKGCNIKNAQAISGSRCQSASLNFQHFSIV